MAGNAPVNVTAWGDTWRDEYIRADVAAAQLAERDARIAELEAAHRWISVDERLPDNWRQEVAVYGFFDGEWQTGYGNYAERRSRWYVGCGIDDEWTVTHWMPLPPPPVTDVTP